MPVSTWNAVTVGASALQVPDGAVAAPPIAFASEPTSGRYRLGTNNVGEAINGVAVMDWNATRLNLPNALAVAGNSALATVTQTGKTTTYNGVTTAGLGTPVIVAYARVTGQSAANASIASYVVGAADGSFEISANLNVSVITVLATTLTCTYTDESNTARTLILPIAQIAGSFIAAGAITALGVWQTPILHIRAKAASTITILSTTGTFSGVTYTAEALIKWTA